AKERKRIVVDWNAATAPEPEAGTLHGLFERAAAATPEATAVVCGDDSLTYGDLNERANHVAYYLRGLRIQPNALVGISMHRSTDLIVGILGILKAGAAYLPLDPRFPVDRLRFMIEDAAVSVLLTQSDLETNLPTDGLRMVRLDSDWPEIAQLEPVPSAEIRPEDLAYVIYTSGSTGRPKGVMVTHQNVARALGSYRELIGPGAGEARIGTNVASYAFDVSVDEIFSSLCFGGAVHVVPYETTLDGRALAHHIVDNGINTTLIMPDVLSGVADAFEELGTLGRLRCLITGLSPNKQRLLQQFRRLSHSLRIYNGYGPTETTCAATTYRFESAMDPNRDVPIGRPFPGYQIYIVNEMLEPVPVGVTGEILIGGIGVSRGYLNRPTLTAERFIPNPFRPDLSPCLYRTGDLGRYRDDGTIEFLGRTDTQVKIRGYRIELREIELAIEKHPLVRSCHVGTSTLAEDDVRLVAYVVCTGDRRCDASVLRQHLLEKLPEYMIPSAFVFLERLPLLPSGKIDLQTLPEPDWGRVQTADRTVPPTSDTEKRLAEVWTEVLKVADVGIMDNFFELGGALAARCSCHQSNR
ncbi:amino acid adenylation domain-containing protein, partial [Candidatus Bipolaricaulota bacterium]